MPDIDWNNSVLKQHPRDKQLNLSFLHTIAEFNLEQMVLEPTHVLGNTLDLVLCSNPDSIQDLMVNNPGFSDHFYLSFIFTGRSLIVEAPVIVKMYDKADIEAISLELYETLRDVRKLVSDKADINEVWTCFRKDLDLAILNHVPTKVLPKRNIHEPFWFTREARKLVNKQRRIYNQYKKTRSLNLLNKYRIMRKENKRLLYQIKKKYMQKTLFDPLIQGNSKPFYSHIKRVRGKVGKITTMQDKNGQLVDSSLLIGDILNEFFHSIFSNDTSGHGCHNYSSDNLDTIIIERNGIVKLIDNQKAHKAPGPDKLGKRDLALVPEIADILTCIFQYSIDTGTIPSIWKLANVVPIHKGDSKTIPNNFRPVSLTSNVCKMLEHILLHYLNIYLEDILCTNQHGFRRGMSCNTQLITTMQQILEMVDGGQPVQIATFDFAKAFDKVSHSLLIDKLHRFNIPVQIINWIEHFLSNRKQQVIINNTVSKTQLVKSGVPQGSVLGPSLFLFYINDIVEGINSNIRLFADDLIIYSKLSDPSDVFKFQDDITRLENWARTWEMSFNVKKCNVMFVGSSKSVNNDQISYILDKQNIRTVQEIKYLGVTINSNLKWENHINIIVNKAMRILGLLKSTLFDADTKVKLIAYKTLCRPLLEYASAAWDPYMKKDITNIEMVQNRAVRFIAGLRGVVSISQETQKIGLETLEKRRANFRMTTLFKVLENEDLHPILTEYFNRLQTKTHMTRANDNGLPKAQRVNRDQFLYSFLPRTMRDMRVDFTE